MMLPSSGRSRRSSSDAPAAATSTPGAEPLFDADLLGRYDCRGPRYTSYPTALQFHEGFTGRDYRDCVAATNADPIPAPLSLYVHIPFCAKACLYCACTKVITGNRGHAAEYMKRLTAEVERQAELFDRDRVVEQLHLGGGTPTFLSMEQMGQLMESIRRHFSMAPDEEGEYSIEVDPRTVNGDTVGRLRRLGFNRLSLGVQDFDPAVQAAVNRVQSEQETLEIISAARENRFRSVSIDLIYGLPRQTVGSFMQTLNRVLATQPDRLSMYNYAHLPRQFKLQRMIREEDLPAAAEKLRILQLSIERITGAGYSYIGMDHFAKADDDLCRAQMEGTLSRNFQGYSTHGDCDLIGLGMSAISAVGACYSQNAKDLDSYLALVDAGGLPAVRGLRMSEDDFVRRRIIKDLICHFMLDYDRYESGFQMDFWQYFAEERELLRGMETDGLVEINDTGIRVSMRGRLLVRNICMAFDRYLREAPGHGLYSRVI